MEQNLRFGLVLSRLAVLKKWAVKYAAFESITKNLHHISFINKIDFFFKKKYFGSKYAVKI